MVLARIVLSCLENSSMVYKKAKMFYDEWLQALTKGKKKEKDLAIIEFTQWLKHPESQDDLEDKDWHNLITGYFLEYQIQIALNSSKALDNKASAQIIATWTQVFKDLIILAASSQGNPFIWSEEDERRPKLWDMLLNLLERKPEIKTITKSISKCLSVLAQKRSYREHLEASQIEGFFIYCCEFFLEDQGSSDADRRPECLDLAVCLSVLITSNGVKMNMIKNAGRILKLISKYLRVYKVENNALEYFLVIAQRLLLLIDVNNLDLSFKFFMETRWRLLELLKSKNYNLKSVSINILRMYIHLGSFRPDVDGEEPSSTQLIYASIRIQKVVMFYLENGPIFIPGEYLVILEKNDLIHLVDDEEIPHKVCYNWSVMNLAADICWLILQSEDRKLFEQGVEGIKADEESGTSLSKKKPAYNPQTRLEGLFKSSRPAMNLCAVQVITLMISRHPSILEKLVVEYGSFLTAFVSSHDQTLGNSTCVCLAKLFSHNREVLEKFLSVKTLWSSTFALIKSGLKRKSGGPVLGAFTLMKVLLSKKLVGTEQMLELLRFMSVMDPRYFEFTDAHDCFESLLCFPNLWSREAISRIIRTILSVIQSFSDESSPQACPLMMKLLLRVLELNVLPATSPKKWHQSLSFLPVIPTQYLFDYGFKDFQIRVYKSSGFYGNELISELLDSLQQQPGAEGTALAVSEIRARIFLSELENFLDENFERIVTSILFYVTIKHVLHQIPLIHPDPKLTKYLVDLQVACVDQCESKEHFLFCLYPFTSMNCSIGPWLPSTEAIMHRLLLEPIQIQRPPILKDDLMDLSGVTNSRTSDVMSISFFDDSVVLDDCLAIEKELCVSAHFISNFTTFKKDVIAHIASSVSNFKISTLLVTGYLWHRLDVFICEIDFSYAMIQWFTESFTKFELEKSLLLHASTIRFLSRMSRFPLLWSDERICGAAVDLINYFCQAWSTYSSEIRADFTECLYSLLNLKEFQSIQLLKPADHAWALLFEMEEFHVRISFAIEAVPVLLKHCDDLKSMKKAFATVQKLVKYAKNSEVECISAAIIYASLFLHCIPLRAEAFTVLCLIAADQPAIDTIECIVAGISDFYSCHSPSPTSAGISMIFLERALMIYDKDNFENSFPEFLFDCSSTEEFLRANSESVNAVYCRKKEYASLDKPGIEKAFCKIYTEYLLTSDSKHSEEIWRILMEFAGSEELLNASIGRQKSSTITQILIEMSGIEDNLGVLPIEFQSKVNSIGALSVAWKSGQQAHANAARAISIISDILLIDNSSADTVRSFIFLQIFNKLHQKLYYYGKLEDLARVVLNGYQTLIIMTGDLIFHPLIFQLVMLQLCRYLDMPFLRNSTVCLIKYCINFCLDRKEETCVNDHSILLLSAIDKSMKVADRKFDGILIDLLTKCAEAILSCIDAYSVKTHDRGISLRTACSTLDHPRFSELLRSFQFKMDDSESLIELVKLYDPRKPCTGDPFHRLASLIDSREALEGDVSSLLPPLYSLLNNTNVTDSDELLGMAVLFAKLSFYTNRGSLLSDSSFNWQYTSLLENRHNDYVATITLLFPYLSVDVETVVKCTAILGRLLAEPEAASCFDDMDTKLVSYISIFKGRKRSIISHAAELSSFDFESDGQSESEWLTQFASRLILKFDFPNFFLLLLPLLEGNSDFAANILPILFHFKLFKELDYESTNNLSAALAEFVKFPPDISKNVICFKHLLNVLKDSDYKLFGDWTVLDFYTLSNAALSVGDHCFAIYLLEFSYARNILQDISGPSWQCLLQSNRELNNSDGFQGVIASLDTRNIELYSLIEEKNCHEKNWMSLWSMEDSILQGTSGKSNALLRQSLSSSGHYHTLAAMLETETGEQNSNEYYESLWRLGKWSVHEAFDTFDGDLQLDRCLYNCLERFENSTSIPSLVSMIDDHLIHFRSLKGNNLAIAPFLEIREAILINVDSKTEMNELLSKWKWRLQEVLNIESFQDIERMLAVRTRILVSVHQHVKGDASKSLSTFLADHLLSLANISLAEKNILLARTSVLQFKTLFPEIDRIQQIKVDVLLQKIEWERGEDTIAMKFFKQTLDTVTILTDQEKALKAEMLHTYGQWLIASRKSTPIQIIEDYLDPAIRLDTDAGLYCYDLAKYADSVYSDMLNDDNLKRSERHLAQREKELQLLLKEPNSKSKEYFLRKTTRQVELDKATLADVNHKRTRFLLISIENYLKALLKTEKKVEHSVSRLVSLWFSNYQSSEVNAMIKNHASSIRTALFLPLMYQLSARLSCLDHDSSASPFYVTLMGLVESIVLDYPYHSIGFLVGLKNVSKGKKKAGLSSEMPTVFLKKLMKNSDLSHIVLGFDKAFSSYIAAASQEISKKGSKLLSGKRFYQLESNSTILDLKSSMNIPVLTFDFAITKPKDYSHIVFIEKVERNYTLPGGINAPKVLEILGSDGVVYKQLVKSKDDLRQDAVLSSVFVMINKLLKRKSDTRKKNLTIRTYKIVPLAPQAGIVQWVDGTKPFGEVMLEAYTQYKSICTWDPAICRDKMKVEQEKSGSTSISKLAVFNKIISNLPVIFGKLFFRLYRDPLSWYQNRSKYMKSVATSSMGGYMLGVGDRHSQNLLFDEASGEIVHIDLGIAFDQGKLLSTPETVPFRLTRNMIDAMGITKYEGEFKLSCEKTLKVLREERDVLFTLLDVFRHDPLHSWTVSPLKMKKVQQDKHHDGGELDGGLRLGGLEDQSEGNDEADIALFGIDKKLSNNLSVESQVQELITTAIDPKNLCALFHGWQSWI